MLTHISKVELAEMAKKMRATANMPKDSLTQKKKAQITITQALAKQDEETTSGLVFKIKRKETAPLLSILTRMVEPPIRTLFPQKVRLRTEM